MTDRAIPTVAARGAWAALALVGLTQAVSLLDRQILAILAPAIKADLGVGDAEMGMLYGTVFALFYALFSLPMGRLADGWTRTKLLSFCLVFWSGATALGGMANSFSILALSRLGVGVGEAATQPAGTSLIYDFWPKHQRGFVMAIMAAAIALGLGGSLILGGVAADYWDGLYAGGGAPFALKGWQFAFFVASLPGFILALLMWFLREPERGQMDGIPATPDPKPFAASWQVLAAVLPGAHWFSLSRQGADKAAWRNNILWLIGIIAAMVAAYTIAAALSPRPPLTLGGVSFSPHALQWGVVGFGLFVLVNFMQNMRLTDGQAHRVITRSPTLLLAITVGSLQSVINYGMMAFNPTFLVQTYELSLKEAALQFGFVSAGMGILGPLVWGPLSDRLNLKFPSGGRAYVALFAMGVSPILSFWVYHAPSAGDFYLRFVVYSFILTGWLPPLYAILYEQVLPRMRAITSSLYLLVLTIIGLGCGPYLVGMMSDATGDLRGAMLTINVVAVPIVVCLLVIARRAEKDEAGLVSRAS